MVNMEEQEEEAIDTRCLRKLDYNAPLLSTRRPNGATGLQLSRSGSQCVWRDTCNGVPFSWEQTPGKPKESEANEAHDMSVPPPKLPPCRWHPPKEALKADNADQHRGMYDDGSDADIDGNDDDDVFSDAMDIFSLSESVDVIQTSNKAKGLESVSSEMEERRGDESPSFIIQRFLADATALAASSSSLALSSNSNKKRPHLGKQTRQSHSSSLQGCGFDIFLPWRMKHKPCGLKSPVQHSSSLNPKPNWSERRKQKSYSAASSCGHGRKS